MVNFYNDYVTCSHTANISDVAGEFLPPVVAQPTVKDRLQPHHVFSPLLSHLLTVEHFQHLKTVGGHTIIGFGGDYDGVTR